MLSLLGMEDLTLACLGSPVVPRGRALSTGCQCEECQYRWAGRGETVHLFTPSPQALSCPAGPVSFSLDPCPKLLSLSQLLPALSDTPLALLPRPVTPFLPNSHTQARGLECADLTSLKLIPSIPLIQAECTPPRHQKPCSFLQGST